MQQGPSDTIVPRFDMCRSIISFSRITHRMWQDQPLSQRNKTTKRAVGVKTGEWVDKSCKKEVGNKGGVSS